MVLALVLAETGVGGAAALWAVPLWGRARPGLFKLVGGALAAAAALSWLAARAPLAGAGPEGRLALRLLGASAAAAVLWQALLWSGARAASRAAGIGFVPVGAAALAAVAAIPAPGTSIALRVFQVLSGALFAGAAADGLLLGHWHLVECRLSRRPLWLVNRMFLVGCALAVAGAVAGGGGRGVARAEFSPLLGVGALTTALAVGLIAICALMAVLIDRLVKEGSTQAATGFFYLAVIMAMAGEFAAKVRFF